MSEKETSQFVAGSQCCCEVVLIRPPSSDLVIDAQGHTPQGNILWIQGLIHGIQQPSIQVVLAQSTRHTCNGTQAIADFRVFLC